MNVFSTLGSFINLIFDPQTGSVSTSPLLIDATNVQISFSGTDSDTDRHLSLTPTDFSIVANTDTAWYHPYKILFSIPKIETYGFNTPAIGAPATPTTFRFKGMLTVSNGSETLFEKEYTVTFGRDPNAPAVTLPESFGLDPIYVRYNKATGTLSGPALSLFLDTPERLAYRNTEKTFIQKTYLESESGAWRQVFGYHVDQSEKIHDLGQSVPELSLFFTKSRFLDVIPNGVYQFYGVFLGISLDSDAYESVKVHLTVEDNPNALQISRDRFEFDLDIDDQGKEDSFKILHFSTSVSLSFPDELILVDENSAGDYTYRFKTKPARDYAEQQTQCFIKLHHQDSVVQIPVTIRVYGRLPENYFFCKDSHVFEIQQQNESSEYIQVKVLLEGIARKVYDFSFFMGKAYVRHGDLVEPFLKKAQRFSEINLEEDGYVSFAHHAPTKVIFTVKEVDFHGNVYAEKEFTHFYYAGKKPKAFPLLTNATVRSTTSDSFVVIPYVHVFKSYDSIKELFRGVSRLMKYNELESVPFTVNYCSFVRKGLYPHYSASQIVEFRKLKLEPKPDFQEHIPAVFINQNHCPDWFVFTGFWEDECNYEHYLQTDLVRQEQAKVKVKKEVTFKLSTGFIFEEEIDLLRELLESELVFVKIDNSWLRTIPISKKAAPKVRLSNLHEQIVELKLLDDTITNNQLVQLEPKIVVT